MKNPRLALALRIAAVVFSVALATTYIACQGGNNDGGSEDPPTDDPAVLPGSKSGAVMPGSKRGDIVLPGSKSSPEGYNVGKFIPGLNDPKPQEEVEPQNEAKPIFMPGSKSEAITPFWPESKRSGTKSKDARPEITPEELDKLEEELSK